MKPYHLGLVLGRFQGLHIGHEAVIRKALSLCDRVIVLIGSADKSGTSHDPFPASLRREMLEAAFPRLSKNGRLILQPLNDLGVGNVPAWGDYVLSSAREAAGEVDCVVYGEGRPQELVFYYLIGRILYRNGDFADYPKFADELKGLAYALAQVRKQADEKCRQYALDYHKEPYNIWVGSGDLWPTAYSYSMCVLEESQWIRTKSVSSPEFFHGTLELLEDDVCMTLLLTEGPTRVLDERVKEFAQRHTKKLTCFDTKDYELPGISDEFRKYLSPVVMAAVLQRISKNIEEITGHSLDIRRYYRKENY